MKTLILLTHQRLDLSLPTAARKSAGVAMTADAALGTVLANMAYYGYAPNVAALEALRAFEPAQLAAWWKAVEPSFKNLTGEDRNMGDAVVYKNFPKEVLAMSEAQYWVRQIFMYIGAPNEWFTEAQAERPALDERLQLKALSPAHEGSLREVLGVLCALKARWTEAQRTHALFIAKELAVQQLALADFGFKENGVTLMAACFGPQAQLSIADATDVLRLAAAVSEQDVSLRTKVVFRNFKRGERRVLLSMLDQSKNLLADMGLRPALWKKLMAALHPGDYKFRNVIEAYHQLYQGEYSTFNGEVEAKLAAADVSVLAQLASRPGDFARRLHKLYAVFGMAAVEAFAGVAPALSTAQLLKLRGYLSTINSRLYLIHPPKGNWNKAQFLANEKTPFSDEALSGLRKAIDAVLSRRLNEALPEGVDLSLDTDDVKLQTNDQELAPYGRGTTFPIPAGVTFVRSASFWQHKAGHNTWFDNGWCFMDANWAPAGACCWDHTHDMGGAAVFSGDPTNSKDLKGRACQMIDLYLDKLVERGVRYAVWNILCFSNVPFSDADEVLGTLQWGEKAEAGKLYEPARAQMVFPLKGQGKTKFIAYLDLVERRVVYLDANLSGKVNSAGANTDKLAERMPALVEYLKSLPSVADLFVHAKQGSVPVLYSDAERTFERGQKAYVFKPENTANDFKPLELTALL